jgi:DNA-binding transcriptional ArsR family regulator
MANKNLSPEVLNLVAERFKVMSEPIRLQILHELQAGEKSVGEITEAIKTSQPNISKHLKILQNAGITKREQKGNTVFYSISDESIFTLCELVCDSLEEGLRNQANIFAQV